MFVYYNYVGPKGGFLAVKAAAAEGLSNTTGPLVVASDGVYVFT